MDELRSFFNAAGPPARHVKKLRGPATGGLCISEEDPTILLNRKYEHRKTIAQTGTDYANPIIARETEMYLKSEAERQILACQESMSGGLESLEQLSAFGTSVPNIDELTEDAMKEVYNKYSFQMKEESNNLAISEYKQQILSNIQNFPVVIIEGPTGCGKTTQVPQWILDDSYQNRKPCRIIVTQPRRIAAISISKRVAHERGWDVGGLVGYQVALENRTSSDTRISYVTTGVLLQKLVSAKTMNDYTHIILDEVHERGQEMDFLLIVVKRLLFTVSPKVKVILMSATFNSSAFSDYFKIATPTGSLNSLCVEVAKQARMFTVKKFYLNQLEKLCKSFQPIGKNEAVIDPEMYEFVVKLIFAFENIDKHEEEFEDYSEAEFPSVLIFLPGINEIEEMYSQLTDMTLRAKIDETCPKYKWWVLPLHSTITADEQVRVFQRAPPGHRKIILATNIAESSITVPDIKYVVDFCLMKHLVADPQTNFTSLQLTWASKANCEQRAGRAGRVRDGRVYRLVNSKFYETLPEECTPEILRCPLERLVLLSKTLDMGPPSDILALAMNPPELGNIHRTVLVMKGLGGLTKYIDDEWCPTDGDLTHMGRIMSKLPLDVRLSKLIVLGHLFGCLDECIIMAAAMSVKSIFSNPFRERLHAYNSKLTWADGCTSDCITLLNVYKVWNHLRKSQAFKQKGTNEVQWARRFYVQVRSLHEMDEMVRELRVRLSREGIEAVKGGSPWPRNELNLALKVILAGAFYPQYFVQVSQDEARERDAVKMLSGLDPRNTVYLKNFPDGQPGVIYASAIKNAIRQKIGDEPRVTFDKNSRKVYLTFDDSGRHAKRDRESGDPSIPGQVVLPVYKAVKARQLKIDIRIPMLPLQRANELALAFDTDKMTLDIQKLVPRLPEIDDTHFPIKICHLPSVGRFWAQYADASAASELRSIVAALRQPLLGATAPRPGDVVAAPRADNSLARARVLASTAHGQLEVLFIDFGVHSRVKQNSVRELPLGVCKSTPPLALPCALAGVGPSPLLDAHAHWTQRAFDEFKRLVSAPGLIAKIYSVVHGVVSVELLADNGRQNVNQELIKRGYAVPCEESYESKMNHDIRLNAPELSLAQRRAYSREQMEQAYYQLKEIDIPDYYKECVQDMCLHGPHSPLETTVHSLMYASREDQVSIEWNSVNSVLLDTDPQEVYERLVVAADVSRNEGSGKLSIRHTTFMPNIAGLPAIMALLFSPTAELRRDAAGTRYVSALCGLGSDDSGAPYFPEHDILVSIDCRLPVDDMGYINHIRHLMDYMMSESNEDVQKQVPKCIRDDLLQLLMKRRKHCEPETVPNAWEWKSVPEQEFLEISVPDMASQAVVYPLIVPLELYPMSHEQLLALKRDNDQLKLLVGRTPISSVSELVCKLCNTGPLNTQTMRLHLFSNAHLEKEEDFRIFQS